MWSSVFLAVTPCSSIDGSNSVKLQSTFSLALNYSIQLYYTYVLDSIRYAYVMVLHVTYHIGVTEIFRTLLPYPRTWTCDHRQSTSLNTAIHCKEQNTIYVILKIQAKIPVFSSRLTLADSHETDKKSVNL